MSKVKRKLFMSVGFELVLLSSFVFLTAYPVRLMIPGVLALTLAGLMVIISNAASSIIIGYVILNHLWPALDREQAHQGVSEDPHRLYFKPLKPVEGKTPDMTWHDYWVYMHRGSPLTRHLGFGERLLLFFVGVHSLSAFFVVAGAWTSIKIAVDWSVFKDLPHRAIGHIYLLGCLFSILFSLLDVVVVRLVFDLSRAA